MRKLILLAALLLAGCSAGHWEKTGKEVGCPRCVGLGCYSPYGNYVQECENCGGDGKVEVQRWVREIERTN